MTDIQTAINRLNGHSICLVKGEDIIVLDDRGIKPIMELIGQGADLSGYSVCDKIVGKAAAMLFNKLGIIAVHALVISTKALLYLKDNGIECTFDLQVDTIINRKGDGMCPMEQTVESIDDYEEAYNSLKTKLASMR